MHSGVERCCCACVDEEAVADRASSSSAANSSHVLHNNLPKHRQAQLAHLLSQIPRTKFRCFHTCFTLCHCSKILVGEYCWPLAATQCGGHFAEILYILGGPQDNFVPSLLCKSVALIFAGYPRPQGSCARCAWICSTLSQTFFSLPLCLSTSLPLHICISGFLLHLTPNDNQIIPRSTPGLSSCFACLFWGQLQSECQFQAEHACAFGPSKALCQAMVLQQCHNQHLQVVSGPDPTQYAVHKAPSLKIRILKCF